ncbi:hypothetical protein IFR05_006665 [Cadophora sp. M221]|nr:hypothetical protein IFR05_006665 [Cadophora sp. M221]
MPLVECQKSLDQALYPDHNARPYGRRPHLHQDTETHYTQDRPLFPKTLPPIYAYPSNKFPYANQNSKGKARGYDEGYGRIITDTEKNLMGLSYHPIGDPQSMERATQDGCFTGDYCDIDPNDSNPNNIDLNDTCPGDTNPSDKNPNNADPNDTYPNDTEPNDTDLKDTYPKDTDPTNADPNESNLVWSPPNDNQGSDQSYCYKCGSPVTSHSKYCEFATAAWGGLRLR